MSADKIASISQLFRYFSLDQTAHLTNQPTDHFHATSIANMIRYYQTDSFLFCSRFTESKHAL